MKTELLPRSFDKSLDGARVLWRHHLSTSAPVEGWVREFSAGGELVRISRTNKPTDAGTWHRVYALFCEGVLEASKAPTNRKSATDREIEDGFPDESGGPGGDL